jgi:Ca2+-binding EF-hand superfamily protein
MTEEEVEFLFKHVTRSVRTIGVVMSVDKLTMKVFTAVDALLIEKTKDAISKALRTFRELFDRHDSNKDGNLEYAEFENMLLECQIAFKPNMFERLILLLDTGKKLSKISFNTLKFFISGELSSHA